jgi:hypothetical protein
MRRGSSNDDHAQADTITQRRERCPSNSANKKEGNHGDCLPDNAI